MSTAVESQPPATPGGRRPRTGSRSYSLKSDKSNGPISPTEKAEKERRDSFLRGESKANPNAAVTELQPSSRNVLEKVTLDSVRGLNVKDASGNLITEPDLSNPTRPRWERPLDTIRSFERAIDGEYTRRSHQRSQSEYDHPNSHPAHPSRRTSYLGPQGRYNGTQSYYGRPDSYYDNYGAAPPPPRARFGRGMSEGPTGRGHNGHGNHPPNSYGHNNASYETTTGSDSTGPWVNSTDPSSQNSSFERLHGAAAAAAAAVGKPGQSPERNYGLHEGYGPQATIHEETDAYGLPPAPPSKSSNQASQSAPRVLTKLGNSNGNGDSLPPAPRSTSPSANEKRKSWLGRRFSKNK